MESFEDLIRISFSRPLTINDFGGLSGLEDCLSEVEDGPLLVSVFHAIESHVSSGASAIPEGLSKSLLDALTGATSPAVYRDAADTIVGSRALLDIFGARLAEESIKQACQPPFDARMCKLYGPLTHWMWLFSSGFATMRPDGISLPVWILISQRPAEGSTKAIRAPSFEQLWHVLNNGRGDVPLCGGVSRHRAGSVVLIMPR